MLSPLLQAEVIVPSIIGGVIVLTFIILMLRGIRFVREREVVIVERLGKYKSSLSAGVHFLVPIVDKPKRYSYRYYASEGNGIVRKIEQKNLIKISTQDQVIDFPRQNVITRDNASIFLDAVLSFKIVNPKQMIYSAQNLQNMLSKLLQAQLRNVAGNLDVDQLIEDASAVNVLTGLLDAEATRWGVKIKFVKIQKIDTPGLEDVLAKKKRADLQNKEIVISAKAKKQTSIIEAEGSRDSMMKEAEGEAQEMLSRANGSAQAIRNQADAEARSIKEISRAIGKRGEDPAAYLLALKYIDALRSVAVNDNTVVKFLPRDLTSVMTAEGFGVNTIFPPKSG